VAVGEAKGENLEWRDAFRHESTPETQIKDGTPVRGGWAWGRRSRHEMESLAEVGRVSVEVHECAVEWFVKFVCERYQRPSRAVRRQGSYRNNPTASQTRARAGE
jgi:hypothetical protein